MKFVCVAFIITYLLLNAYVVTGIIIQNGGIAARDVFVTAVTMAVCMVLSVGAIAGILFVICRCLQLMGISSIKGHPVEFSWPLVAVVWYSMILINAIKQGGKRR